MYKLHLILKYLRKRRIAWVSLIAVMLCTAMVLVVISVMGGWLRMFEENFRRITGDIVITGSGLRGFAYYERMLPEIEKLPDVSAASPVIQGYGLININNQKSEGVQVIGYQMDKIGKINGFPKSLWFQHQQYLEQARQPGLTTQQRQELLNQAQQAADHASFNFSPLSPEERARLGATRKNWPSMIIGSSLLEIRKDEKGRTVGREMFKYELPAKLVLVDVEADIGSGAGITPRAYWIIDDSHTGAWQYDSTTVYVPFEAAQQDMGMTAEQMTNRAGQPVTKPARTHEIHVRLKPDADMEKVKTKIADIVLQVYAKASAENELAGLPSKWTAYPPRVETWRENKATYLSAVENEKILVVFLFSMISIVAVFLIFCIFYMIVVEKTRDIGIIKSVGATSAGVAGIFLGYGAAIGIAGGGMGFVVGYYICRYINEIHQQLGKWMGIQIWKPEVYVFDTIPSTINPREAAIIVGVAIISSIVGALVPAIRAARMNPVEAVRYE